MVSNKYSRYLCSSPGIFMVVGLLMCQARYNILTGKYEVSLHTRVSKSIDIYEFIEKLPTLN